MARSRIVASAALVAALALTATVVAQDQEGGRRGPRSGGGGFGFGFGGPGRGVDKATLLGSEQVRGELKLSEEQAKKVEGILTTHREAQREAFSSLRDVPREERDKAREEMQAKVDTLRKKTDGELAAALGKEQIKRLDEILLQQQGVDALASEPVIASLKLSEEQVTKVRAALKARDDKAAELRPSRRRGEGGEGGQGGQGGGREGFEAAREKMEALRKETEGTVLGILSQEQSAAFAKLKGEPFELDRASLFRGFGRGGQGRGDGSGSGEGEGGRRRRPAPEGEA
jgi:hypothetical protein